MSHTVVRGKPTAAQLYLDTILDEVLLERGLKLNAAQRERVTLTQLLFHCLKRKPQATFMTNGATGETITNGQLLRRAVALARALVAEGARGKHVMLLMRNHQHMIVVYFAVLFAGIVPFFMDPNTTIFELTHFLNLIEPAYVFYDREHDKVLQESLNSFHIKPTIFIVDEPEHLKSFIGNTKEDIQSFQIPDALPEDTVLLAPTSGSTGLPKAAAITHVGTITQMSTPWSYDTKFPTPTRLVMVLTSIQWMTFTMTMTSCVAFHIPLLISPKPNTVENVIDLLEKFRPTWTFFTPAFTSGLVPLVRPDQLTSLETLTLLGAPLPPELAIALQAKLPKTAQLCNGYGSTEAQGYITVVDKDAPHTINGKVVNCLHYKIVDENGQELGLKQAGELLLKGACIIKKYHKNDTSYKESLTDDGWFRTGDKFYLDENENLSFVIRLKFSFKYQGCQVAPEEVENAIFTVQGVHESAVCATDNGPAAAVVKQPNAEVTKEQIHQAVNDLLSEHKRLHGGIVFVPSLPHTHTGKIDRKACMKVILEAVNNGQCC